MWRAAARQLGRKRLEQCRSSEHHHSFPFVSNLSERRKLASSALAAAGHVIKKGGDRESAIIDPHWSSLQASTTSLASSGLPLCPSSATAASLLPARTRVDETLDAALYGLVNLPWLFLQSFSGQDSINPPYPVSSSNSSKAHAVAGLDYNRAFVSVAEAVEDDDETEGELETDVPSSKEGKRSTTPALDEAKRLRKKQYELRKRQLKVETEAWQKAAENYKELMLEMCRKNLAPNLPFAQSLLLGWFEPLRDAIQQEQKEFENLEFREHRSTYGPFMAQLPADMLAVITMHRLMGLLMSDQEHGCVKVLIAALQIGEAVEQEVNIFKLMNSKKKYKKKKKKDLKAAGHINTSETLSQPETTVEDEIKSTKLQKKIQKLVKQQKLRLVGSILRQASSEEAWGPAIHAKVGSRLLELMLETAFVRPPADQNAHDVTELQPAFKHTQKNYPLKSSVNRIYGVIECDPLVLREVDKSVRHMVMPYMPMLVKPKPWKGFYEGGYLRLKSSIMRTHGAKEQRDTVMDTPRRNMTQVVKALDALGETPWRINGRVLDVLERMWREGGRLADLVDHCNVPVPDRPSTEDAIELRDWRRASATAKRINSERHSMRCDTELKLAVARQLRNEEAFFYPHNLDFRGRAYPMHPHLNHLGSDMCRGILEFAEGRTLGPNGLKWLKIHLANLFGGKVGKMAFQDRVAYVDNQWEKIVDSVERPLDGHRWWLEAEDPFQCLATCMDICNAVASGNPETYVSYLPVHQDGSCNGLQHYAALGRDRHGAESVNLIAGDKPADVYSGIAARVRGIMEKDALKDPATNRSAANARLLLNEIDRKLVKQTVMTSVYGVTFVGARTQILNRLKERDTTMDQSVMYSAACYAAKTTLDALGEMFKEARCIMTWLGDCAKIIASTGQAVKWNTPLGLPVVQPYRKPGRHLVKTSLQVLALRNLDADQPVLVQRQRSAFPPNFVHSLDSSHMMMTALACKDAGLFFAGVHDSYWTHAGDVEKMNHLLREKFVELYSKPILENLLSDFQEQMPNLSFPEVPERGCLDLEEVLKATYFFN